MGRFTPDTEWATSSTTQNPVDTKLTEYASR